MRSLFSDNRLANTLYLFRGMQTLSISSIASKLEVSDRTVRNDIKQLNQMLKGCAAIQGTQGRYTLRVFDNDRFQKLLHELTEEDDFLNSPRNRMDYLFGKLLRADLPLLTDDLAYEMSVGRSTLVADLKKLRTELEPYHITIKGIVSQGLTLLGEEAYIRRYILDTNYDQVYRDYPLDREVEDLIASTFARSHLENKVQTEFRQFIIVMLDRFLTGHYIGPLTARYYNLTATPEFLMVSELIDGIGRILQVEFPAEEKLFTLLPIIGMRTPADIDGMHAMGLDDSIRPLLEKILEQIRTETNLTIRPDDFQEEFLYHLMFMLNRLRFHVQLRNPVMADLMDKYPLAYRMAGIAAEIIHREYGLNVTVDEQGYLATYFSVFLAEIQQRKERPFRVAVVCGTGRVSARLVSMQLQKILDSTTVLEQFSADRVTTRLLDSFDIVLSTVDLPCSSSSPVIRISEIFNEQDLRHRIEKVRYLDQVDVPVLDNNWFIMAGLLDRNRFFLLDSARTYQEGVEKMVRHLIADGQLDKGFLERLREREKKGTMVFDQGVAIPHSIQYVDDRLVLAIGIFPNPLPCGVQKVQIVFLLGLPQETEENNLLIRIYDEILSISRDPELLAKIAEARTLEALLLVLYREA